MSMSPQLNARQFTAEQMKQLRENSKKEIERAKAFKDMIRTEGWAYYTELLDTLIATQMQGYLDAIPDNAALAFEHKKGTIKGLVMARDSVRVSIETAAQIGGDEDDDTAEEK